MKIRKYISKKLHDLAYLFYTETFEEIRNEFFKLKGGKEEDYCEKCDCFCRCHPCEHSFIKE